MSVVRTCVIAERRRCGGGAVEVRGEWCTGRGSADSLAPFRQYAPEPRTQGADRRRVRAPTALSRPFGTPVRALARRGRGPPHGPDQRRTGPLGVPTQRADPAVGVGSGVPAVAARSTGRGARLRSVSAGSPSHPIRRMRVSGLDGVTPLAYRQRSRGAPARRFRHSPRHSPPAPGAFSDPGCEDGPARRTVDARRSRGVPVRTRSASSGTGVPRERAVPVRPS
jgi:hypothetical protein